MIVMDRDDIPVTRESIEAAKAAQARERIELLQALGSDYEMTDDGQVLTRKRRDVVAPRR